MTNEKKPRFKTVRNIIEVLKITVEMRPQFKWQAALVAVVPLLLFLTAAFITNLWAIFVPLAIFSSLIGFMLLLSKSADKAGMARLDGQPGAAGAILGQVKFASTLFEEEPVAFDAKTKDLIFRGTGRAGVFLVTEGPNSRIKNLVNKELTRTKRVLPNVPIHIINSGNDTNQVPLNKLRKTVVKQKVTLNKSEVLQIRARLKSLGGMRLPIPKGMDPMRMQKVSRRALRG